MCQIIGIERTCRSRQVRTGLAAGGKWIRTIGTAEDARHCRGVASRSPTFLSAGNQQGRHEPLFKRYARDGFTVVVNYSGNDAIAEALVRKIEAAGGRALSAKADVGDPQAVRGLFDAAEAAFGGIDVLVNNAGIMKLATLADSDDALFDSQVAVNLKGTFNALREASRRLRNGGRIVNFSTSVIGLRLETYGRLRGHQGRRRSDDARSRQGTARPLDHGQRHRAGTDGHRLVPEWEVAGTHRSHVQDEPAGAGSARPRTLPPPSLSSSARTAPGSTAKSCAPTAEWSERNPAFGTSPSYAQPLGAVCKDVF
jgi:hypothetical protein